MHSYLRRAVLGVTTLVAAACAAPQGEDLSESSSALANGFAGPSIPYPGSAPGNTAWSGSPGELAIADALMVCTLNSGAQPRGEWVTDTKLTALRGKMGSPDGSVGAWSASSLIARLA
jgi:hypothetical protein